MTPVEVDALEVAFGPRDISKLLPPMRTLPRGWAAEHAATDLMSAWFFGGLKDARFETRAGIEITPALRHIKACLMSFEPAHEHKQAGVTYLLASFFRRVHANGKTYDLGELPPPGLRP